MTRRTKRSIGRLAFSKSQVKQVALAARQLGMTNSHSSYEMGPAPTTDPLVYYSENIDISDPSITLRVVPGGAFPILVVIFVKQCSQIREFKIEA